MSYLSEVLADSPTSLYRWWMDGDSHHVAAFYTRRRFRRHRLRLWVDGKRIRFPRLRGFA